MSQLDFAPWSAGVLARVESALGTWVPASAPAGLGEAMRHGVLDGGKRLRALLVMGAAQACGALATPVGEEAALRAACAMELIHGYSLIHDDMPCMDNDVLRRGKPTVHVQFGEAQAMLAGDAMQALAFEVLTPEPGEGAGVASVGHRLNESQLRDMHQRKTGALLRASVLMGAAAGGVASDSPTWAGLQAYGHAMGLAFQIVDDVLDATQNAATLGKTAGKDADANKPTYVSLLGLDAAQAEAQALRRQAGEALARTGLSAADTAVLSALADRIVQRDH